ncbi:hypothetical protein CEXT_58901 [Caerostris extrusa]|uniref:Uncharacterized protein n=1 Tax=Caerostris extrusa TaxID=172846 RepID=A0AAV4QSG9_CAEEX|nr:hypothetical protein CEXT_58901 [Caerostris extrusa]
MTSTLRDDRGLHTMIFSFSFMCKTHLASKHFAENPQNWILYHAHSIKTALKLRCLKAHAFKNPSEMGIRGTKRVVCRHKRVPGSSVAEIDSVELKSKRLRCGLKKGCLWFCYYSSGWVAHSMHPKDTARPFCIAASHMPQKVALKRSPLSSMAQQHDTLLCHLI